MSGRTRVVLGVLGVVAVLAVALFFFARYQLTKSFPQTSGSLALPGLLNEVSIYRDGYGVPRIVATSEHDALFAIGFVHAQDRLWQMDMQRRAAEGRLSELFGTATLSFDRMFRIVGLKRIAQQIERSLSEETRRRLQWSTATASMPGGIRAGERIRSSLISSGTTPNHGRPCIRFLWRA